MQSALLLHDKARFDIYLYAITRHDSSQYRQVLQREIPNFRSLPNTKTDKACAQVIADDGIHVLINLNRCLQKAAARQKRLGCLVLGAGCLLGCLAASSLVAWCLILGPWSLVLGPCLPACLLGCFFLVAWLLPCGLSC
jgi:hypothetical protein